jgi:hypothetical protein
VKGSSGSSRVAARCAPDENLVAKGDAVGGKGFRRTGDDDEVEETERPRARIDSERIRGLLFLSPCWAGGLVVLVTVLGGRVAVGCGWGWG